MEPSERVSGEGSIVNPNHGAHVSSSSVAAVYVTHAPLPHHFLVSDVSKRMQSRFLVVRGIRSPPRPLLSKMMPARIMHGHCWDVLGFL